MARVEQSAYLVNPTLTAIALHPALLVKFIVLLLREFFLTGCNITKLDGLSVTQILETLEASLREKNLLVGERPEPTDFALLLVNSFVRFPGQARQRPD